MVEYTTIRLDRKAKAILDSFTPKDKSYSDTIKNLASLVDEAEIGSLFLEGIRKSSTYTKLEDLKW